MSWIWQQLLALWSLFWLLALVILLASPYETLGWWAGWNRGGDLPTEEDMPLPTAPRDNPMVVYLTGVAGFSGDFLSPRERDFLERLRERIPSLTIVDDVFPFSVNNNPLDGDRFLRWLWVWLHRWSVRLPNSFFDILIILRNIAQTLVSADPRYGPVYNAGVGRELALSLLRHGYDPHRDRPVCILAYSGGAQIGVGAAPYLREYVGARIHLVSLGGVYTDDPGIEAVEHVLDLKGNRDRILPALGWLFFPGRWRALLNSPWNRARRQGRLEWFECGPMSHIGGRDYFSRQATLTDGRRFGDAVADTVAAHILRRHRGGEP